MNLEDHVRPRPHQDLVAALKLGAAEIVYPELLRLQHRPGGAIQHQDPLRHERAQLGCPVGAGGDEAGG